MVWRIILIIAAVGLIGYLVMEFAKGTAAILQVF